MSLSPPTPKLAKPMLKGSVLRGYVEHLTAADLLDAVLSRVPEDTRQRMITLPLANEWVSSQHMVRIANVLGSLSGAAAVRRMGRQTVRTRVFVLLRPLLQGMIRLFGASPTTVIMRTAQIASDACRGYRFIVEPRGDKSCNLEIRVGQTGDGPMAAEGWAAAYDEVLELCGVTGRARVVKSFDQGEESVMHILVDWI